MVGTGEYTTGFVNGGASGSDKGAGVVALTLFDLRQRGKVGALSMAGTNGQKFPGIREHFQRVISQRYQLDATFDSFPADNCGGKPDAYLEALAKLEPGDLVTIFTPDDTHFPIAMAAIEHGCHVLIAKPLVQTLAHHQELAKAAVRKNVLCALEVHKRWDPIYADARDRMVSLGNFSHFSAYMSQPKSQLETFRSWAGKSSDISYYLNAHHVDFLVWSVRNQARPVAVTAIAAHGVAREKGLPTEDSITLATRWEHLNGYGQATAIFTASWIAPKSDVHSQQHFFYQAEKGEIRVDQAHRGYHIATDENGYSSPNPLFMKYTPDADGHFAGQAGYGYRSIADFVEAASSINRGESTLADWDGKLATAATTLTATAILEAGRRSLDHDSRTVTLHYTDGQPSALSL